MKHYWFEIRDNESPYDGEEFLVGADNKDEAYRIAWYNIDARHFKLLGTMTDMEAEASGLDEY